jgi:hypothetical protein
MGAWSWPRQLALAVLVLSFVALLLEPARHWEAALATGARPLTRACGPLVARALLRAGVTLQQAGARLPVPGFDASPLALLPHWQSAPDRLWLHAGALSIWLGLLAPLLSIALRGRADDPQPAGSGPHALDDRLHWPLWRRGLGVLPLLTLLWSLSDLSTLWLAPAWATLWLVAARALWWMPERRRSAA